MEGERSNRGVRLLVLTVIALWSGALCYDYRLQNTHQHIHASQCLSNGKQLAMSTFMYSYDYDHFLPPPDAWADEIEPYVKHPNAYRCATREEGYGLGFNRWLTGGQHIEDPRLPMIFETDLLSRNVATSILTMPDPGRHGKKDTVAFADGHAKYLTAAEAFKICPYGRPSSFTPPPSSTRHTFSEG